MSVELNKLSKSALSAAMRGGTAGWGVMGSANEHVRYSEPINSRRRCTCGCKTRRTHAGMANGVALMSGCQLRVARWVRGISPPAAQGAPTVLAVNIPNGPRIVRVQTDTWAASWPIDVGWAA